MSRNGKVIVAMSGGVDSAVSAWLLKQQGFECIGVFMRNGAQAPEPTDCAVGEAADPGRGSAEASTPSASTFPGAASAGASPSPGTSPSAGNSAAARSSPTAGASSSGASTSPAGALPGTSPGPRRLAQGCCSAADAQDARAIAARIGMPFYALNFEQDFHQIIDYFVDEYARGRTPNPCVVCNTHLKFGKLLRYADALDAEFVATGHYARILRRDGQVLLARAANLAKDQSYVLFGIARAALGRCLFPLGDMPDKAQVRSIAAELGLRVHDKPDSQEICFVPGGDYKELVRQRRPDTQRVGEVRDPAGRVLGTHSGIANYTIGQRQGLGIAVGRPAYVTKLDVLNNVVTLGSREDLLSGGLVAEKVNWLTAPPAVGQPRPASLKVRYTHRPAAGFITVLRGGEVEARFAEPQSAVTPGQAVVFYDGDIVLGGGWISRAGTG